MSKRGKALLAVLILAVSCAGIALTVWLHQGGYFPAIRQIQAAWVLGLATNLVSLALMYWTRKQEFGVGLPFVGTVFYLISSVGFPMPLFFDGAASQYGSIVLMKCAELLGFVLLELLVSVVFPRWIHSASTSNRAK